MTIVYQAALEVQEARAILDAATLDEARRQARAYLAAAEDALEDAQFFGGEWDYDEDTGR